MSADSPQASDPVPLDIPASLVSPLSGGDAPARVSADAVARGIADRAGRSLRANQPLFIVVYYGHEADKLDLLDRLRNLLREKGISTRTFDPAHQETHGAGKLYGLMIEASAEPSICLVTSVPRENEGIRPQRLFFSYLNLNRDMISFRKIRFVLFLHDIDAEMFLNVAGDLWDFRQTTYWLERSAEPPPDLLWRRMDDKVRESPLTEEIGKEIAAHLASVRPLIGRTKDPEDKAGLLLDLCQWLGRRNAWRMASEVGIEGISVLGEVRSRMRAALEYETGHSLYMVDEYAEAMRHYKICLDIRRELGDWVGEGAVLNDMAAIFWKQGDTAAALDSLEQALALRKESGDHAGEAVILNNIGQLYAAFGKDDMALRYLERSVSIQREPGGDAIGEGSAFLNIAGIYRRRGDNATALRFLERSLLLQRKAGSKTLEAYTLNGLAALAHANGDEHLAMDFLERALTLQREIGAREGEAVTLNNIGVIHLSRGDAAALPCFERSLILNRETGSEAGESEVLRNMAHFFDQQGDLQAAIEHMARAVEIRKRLQHPDYEACKDYLESLRKKLLMRQGEGKSA